MGSDQVKNPDAKEYYDNISLLMDHTLINANRLLERLKPPPAAKKPSGSRPPPIRRKSSSSSSVPMSSSSTSSSKGASKNYANTPSRLRSKSSTGQSSVSTPSKRQQQPPCRKTMSASSSTLSNVTTARNASECRTFKASEKDSSSRSIVYIHRKPKRGITIKHAGTVHIKARRRGKHRIRSKKSSSVNIEVQPSPDRSKHSIRSVKEVSKSSQSSQQKRKPSIIPLTSMSTDSRKRSMSRSESSKMSKKKSTTESSVTTARGVSKPRTPGKTRAFTKKKSSIQPLKVARKRKSSKQEKNRMPTQRSRQVTPLHTARSASTRTSSTKTASKKGKDTKGQEGSKKKPPRRARPEKRPSGKGSRSSKRKPIVPIFFDATIQMTKKGCRRNHRLAIQAEFHDQNLTKLILNGKQCRVPQLQIV
uniref:Serine/arginine repetitive matrix protein 2-like n=1 Tax=Haemonchus contortus TaxID=6289 RepID=A0A7I5E5R3_HAECO